MSVLQQGFKLFRENFFQLFLYEFFFLFSSFFYFLFLKTYMEGYLGGVREIAPSLAAIEKTVGKEAQAAQLQQLIGALAPSTQAAMLVLFVLTPIFLLASWIIFQGFIWKMLSNKKTTLKIYFKNIAVATIIAFLLCAAFFIIAIPSIVANIVVFFVIYAALTMIYVSPLTGKSIKSYVQHASKGALFILPLFITSLILAFLMMVLLISMTSGEFFFLSPIPLILYITLCIVVNIFMKAVAAALLHQSSFSSTKRKL